MGLLDNTRNHAAKLTDEDRKAVVAWAKEREELARVDPLNYGFDPHEVQLRLHRSTSQEILFVAANRVGKSTAGMREVLWRATGTHPHKKVRPHEQIWCGFPDYPFFLRHTLRMYRAWYPRDRLVEYNKAEKWATFRREDGGTCQVFFVSYDSGRDKWQGAAVDFIWLDEECPQEIYEEANARLADSGGDLLMTQTPVSGLGWVYDDIFVPAQEGRSDIEVVEGALAEYRDECRCHPEHGEDAHPGGGACEHGDCGCDGYEPEWELMVGPPLVPHMDRAKILRFARRIKDPLVRLIRIFGKFRARAGTVYKQFSRDIHVIPAFPVPAHWEAWGGIDPGFHGFAVVLLVQDPQGRVYVAYEYFSQHETTGLRAREIWRGIQKVVTVPEDEYIVFYVDTEDPQTVLELNTWAANNGARIVFASLDQGLKARKAGVGRIQEYLQPSRKRSTPAHVRRERPPQGEPLVYFFDSLQSSWLEGSDGVDGSRLLWEIVRYLWARGRKKEDADDRSAGGAHALSCFRYAMMARVGPPEELPQEEHSNLDPVSREVWEHLRELDERESERAEWREYATS
jgi:phage terminase large subunit-like protein